MPVKNETSTRFMDELRIISPETYIFVFFGNAAVLAAFAFAGLTDRTGDRFHTLPVLVPLGILAAALISCYILLIGYVNADAGRRGMSRLAWTLLAIFIPNALGIVLYFVLRKPRIPNCPQCRTAIEPAFGFCPRCRYRLTPVCPQCQRGVHEGDKFCPYCGCDLGARAGIPSAPAANPS